jgi:serine/threonine-protein kinase HipA
MVTQVVNVNYSERASALLALIPNKDWEHSNTALISLIAAQLSQIKMPLSRQIYWFPDAQYEEFRGLPGLVADSLPDDFGNVVLNAWVASRDYRRMTLHQSNDCNIAGNAAWAHWNIHLRPVASTNCR